MDDVIIIGSLDKKELEKSINELVTMVDRQMGNAAVSFDAGISLMESSLKRFHDYSKTVSGDLKNGFREMGLSFDAVAFARQSTVRGSSNSGGSSSRDSSEDLTVGDLRESIRAAEKYRDTLKQWSPELEQANREIEVMRRKLREMTEKTTIAQRIKTETKDISAAITMPAKSLSEAEAKLQRLLVLQQRNRSLGILDEGKMNRLQNAIDNVQRKIERIKNTAPKSLKEVLGMDESSVDAIARKMQALKGVSIDPKNTSQVSQLGNEYQRLSRLQSELLGKNIQMTHSNNYLAQSFGYIRNRVVYALTLGAITSFVKQIYEIRGQYELLERSLGVLVNSFERGSQIFQELNQMAIESPFTLLELAGAAKQLTAYDFAANEVVDTTRRLADISAALGVPMERLTYNLGQIRAQTVLTARDARDFANAGLPIVSSLAERFTQLEGKVVTTGDVFDRMKKKMVSYSDVMAVLNEMTDEGGKFFDFQAKQAETLRVQMANLNLAWNNMLNDIGEGNQGLLTMPISALKSLFQNWQSIDRIIKSILVTFGLWKGIQMVAIRQQWAWAAATGATAKQMGSLANVFKSVKTSMADLFSNPWTWVFVGIMAVTDLVNQWFDARAAMHELNEDIKKDAEEASTSMLGFLNNKGNRATVELARQNKLTAEQGEKAWESFKEQISQSALSANSLISELQAIPDVNERITKSFDYAERIQKAQAALQDLKDDTIEVSRDFSILGIGLKDGLVEDLKDLVEDLGGIAGTTANMFDDNGQLVEISDRFIEYRNELEKTAQSINNFISAYNITDPLQINEILERVRAQIKAKNPQIKGDFAKIFDITLDERMYALTNGAVDKNTSLWKIFMDRLRHNSSAAFQDITDDWVKNSDKLSTEQQNAINDNLKYFKDTMPMYYNAVSEMVADASKLKIQIGIAFNTQQVTDFQHEVNKRIGESKKMLDFGGSAYLPTNNDDLVSWVDTQQKAIKKLGEENKKYQKDNTEWSKQKIADNDREIQQRKNLLDLFNQSYEAEKKTKTKKGRKTEDVIAEALKQELSLIDEMRSSYEKLRKAGVSNMDAIDLASRGYEATIMRINNVLQKFGIDKFNASNFAGKDVRGLLQSLEQQRDALLASGKVKTTSVKDLDVKIQKLTVDAKTYDMKKVTDGLNNELGKLKDEYELAIELDANPELGSVFADMFDIDVDALPQTFGEMVDKAQSIINGKLKELKIESPFELMRTQIESIGEGDMKIKGFAENVGLDVDSEAIKELIKWQNTYREMFKKNITETEKMLDDYVRKYGDYSDRIAEVESNRLEKLKKLNDAYYTDEMRKRPEYLAKLNAIEEGSRKEKSNIKFDDFKNSRYYTMMFENLDYVSTKTIRDMRDKLRGLIDDMKDLTPEQLKQVMNQYEKLEQKLVRRSPFKTLTKDVKEYFKTAKERRTANEDFRNAQRDYDAQKEIVAALKEKYEQAKAVNTTPKEYLDSLQIEVGAEDEILKKLKEQLELAQKKADQYNLIKKLALEEAEATAQVIAQNLSSLSELRDNLQQTFGIDFGDDINAAVDGLNRAGSGLSKAVSSLQSGNVVGAASGVVDIIGGIGDGIASIFGDGAARTKRINREINNSVEAVRRLNMAYKELEVTVNNAMGAQELQARREQVANKQAQLEELKRQMQLEQSKRSKDRSDDDIKQYEESIQDLQLEIDELKKCIVSTLLGGDIKSAAESFVSTWVDAWRQGGDTMEALGEKFDDMIDTMIAKSVASYLVSKRLQGIFDAVDKATDDMSEGGAEITMDELKRIRNIIGDKSVAELINEDLTNLYNALGIAYGVDGDASKSLSALQQGISQISEDTAGALEAYMNIVSQKVFEQNDILVQIRDMIQTFDFDVHLGVLSQMLLQLQSSYQTQQAIQQILEGALTPSGRAFAVELLS